MKVCSVVKRVPSVFMQNNVPFPALPPRPSTSVILDQFQRKNSKCPSMLVEMSLQQPITTQQKAISSEENLLQNPPEPQAEN